MFYLRENITDLVKILRGLSESKKKVIIICVVVVCAIVLGFFWVQGAAKSIAKATSTFRTAQLPSIDFPDMSAPSAVAAPQDPTADWKMYADTEYGFEIKYPKDWQQRNYDSKAAQALLGFCPVADASCKQDKIYLVIYKDPYTIKDESDYYLGKGAVTGFYYYLYNSSSQNRDIFEKMISAFKFTN